MLLLLLLCGPLFLFACAQLSGSLPASYGKLAYLERLSLNDNTFRCLCVCVSRVGLTVWHWLILLLRTLPG